MFKITKDGVNLGMTEFPIHIKQAENGCFVLCPEPEASGVVYGGTVYHLQGRKEMAGVETICMEQVDAGLKFRALDDTAKAVSLLALANMGIVVEAAELAEAQGSLLDTAAVEIITEETGDWKDGGWVSEGDIRAYNGTDYIAMQRHYIQPHYPPDTVPALWKIKGKGEGTTGDPITAAAGMGYQYGLYYLDPADNRLYHCTRTGEAEGGTVILHYLPHQLVGNYFELVVG